MIITTRADVFAPLRDLGAPARLVRHVEFIGEAADALLVAFAQEGVSLDENFVRMGGPLGTEGEPFRMLDGNIGYVNLMRLQRREVAAMFNK
jgi:hypothetical protein